MSLYENWIKKAYDKNGQSVKELWDEYMPLEQNIYENLLETKAVNISGTPASLAEKYNMNAEFVCGFLDGINAAAENPLNMEELAEDQPVSIDIDFERLYKKMVEFKAEHLYTLPQWNGIFSPEKQKDLYYEQKKSGTVVKEKKPSRNDPCPCGSGKKYKKCCGVA